MRHPVDTLLHLFAVFHFLVQRLNGFAELVGAFMHLALQFSLRFGQHRLNVLALGDVNQNPHFTL